VTSIRTSDDLQLEARWDDATGDPSSAIVLCHPHPLDGGTMHAPLMQAVTRRLNAAGMHTLRFNFRGVGTSEGHWGKGLAEVNDVEAAVEAARLAFPNLDLGIAGWSFGASTSLRWQVESNSTLPWVGIAPGIRSYRGSQPPAVGQLQPARRLIVFGDRDQFATTAAMEAFAAEFDASVEVLTGSDHFFYFREDAVGDIVADHFQAATTG
jgi:alpha/beta superfamily hydrolase